RRLSARAIAGYAAPERAARHGPNRLGRPRGVLEPDRAPALGRWAAPGRAALPRYPRDMSAPDARGALGRRGRALHDGRRPWRRDVPRRPAGVPNQRAGAHAVHGGAIDAGIAPPRGGGVEE